MHKTGVAGIVLGNEQEGKISVFLHRKTNWLTLRWHISETVGRKNLGLLFLDSADFFTSEK